VWFVEKLIRLLAEMLKRRQLAWVEISVTRAWSRDMAPRLFDLSDR
jgi:hypothetical protein